VQIISYTIGNLTGLTPEGIVDLSIYLGGERPLRIEVGEYPYKDSRDKAIDQEKKGKFLSNLHS